MNEYYTCKIGVVEYFFEVEEEVIGVPNECLGLGISEQMCFVPAKGSLFVNIPGHGFAEANSQIYSIENFMFPVDDCRKLTHEDKYYKTLSEGFGI